MKYNDQKFESNITFEDQETRKWVDRNSFALFDGSQASVDDVSKLLRKAGHVSFWQCVDIASSGSSLNRIKFAKSEGSDGYEWVYKNDIVFWDGTALHLFRDPEDFYKSYRIKDGVSHITIKIEVDGNTTELQFDNLNGVFLDTSDDYRNGHIASPKITIDRLLERPGGGYYTLRKY